MATQAAAELHEGDVYLTGTCFLCFRCLWTLRRTKAMTITPKTTRWGRKTWSSMCQTQAQTAALPRRWTHRKRVPCDREAWTRPPAEGTPPLQLLWCHTDLKTVGGVSCHSMQLTVWRCSAEQTETWSTELCRVCLFFWTSDEESKSFQTAVSKTFDSVSFIYVYLKL